MRRLDLVVFCGVINIHEIRLDLSTTGSVVYTV